MYHLIFMGYTFWHKDKYSSEIYILMDYEHNKILLQGNVGVKSIIIKKKHGCQINFERISVNFNIEGIYNRIFLCNYSLCMIF